MEGMEGKVVPSYGVDVSLYVNVNVHVFKATVGPQHCSFFSVLIQ